MIGLLVLLGIALALVLLVLTALLVHEMRHPPRHTAGYAVARGLAVDPGELGLEFEQWNLERPGGVTLPVWEIINPQSKLQDARSRLTAVFIHGWGHSRIDSLARIQPFLSLCDRVILYDLRGHGEATATSRLGDGEDDDLLTILDELGDGSFLLVGHSMGAVIAISAAAKGSVPQHRVAGIIAYGPYLDFHKSLRGRLRAAGYPTRPITDLALLWLRLIGIRPRSLTESLVKNLTCPLLVIHGEHDLVAPLDDGRRIAAAASNATFHIVASAAHVDSHIVDEAQHETIVQQFVASLAVAGATMWPPPTASAARDPNPP